MMMKKGQAAMEFLMTYGWAILVVLAAIGALAYFGVLSPNSMLPERTTFQAPLPAIDNAVVSSATGDVQIAFKNNKGNPITINVADTFSGTDDCSGLSALAADNANPANGETFTLTFTCAADDALAVDSRFDAGLSFEYTDDETGLSRPHSGQVQAKITA